MNTYILRRWFSTVIVAAVVSGCGGGGGGGGVSIDAQSETKISSIEVSPKSILFSSAGQTMALNARALDEFGRVIPNVNLKFNSSSTAISTSQQGLVRAEGAIGSAVIAITAGDVSAAPVVVSAVETRPGTVLIQDDQVNSAPVKDNATNTYTFSMPNENLVAAGDYILGGGEYPIAGLVTKITSSGAGGENIITFKPLPLTDLIRNASIAIHFTESQMAAYASAIQNGFTTQQSMGLPMARSKLMAASQNGRFICNQSFDSGLLKMALVPDIDISLTPPVADLEYSILEYSVTKFMLSVDGVAGLSMDGSIEIGSAKGSLDCRALLKTIPIPISGPLSYVAGAAIPIDALVKADVDLPDVVGLDFKWRKQIDFTVGLKYEKGIGWTDLSKHRVLPGTSEITPRTLNGDDINIKLFAGLSASLAADSSLLGYKASLVEAQIGNQLSWTGALPKTSAAGGRAKSEDITSIIARFVTGHDLVDFVRENFQLDIDLTLLSLELPTSTSPQLLVPATADKDSYSAGDRVKFVVDLDPSTLRDGPFGAGTYDIQEVVIYEQVMGSSGIDLKPILSITQEIGDQSKFIGEWVADADGSLNSGNGTSFYAYVVPKFLQPWRKIFPVYLGKIVPILDLPEGADYRQRMVEDVAYALKVVDFGFTDPDTGDTFKAVRIDTRPLKGAFLINGVPVEQGDVINKADIDAGKLTFKPAQDESGLNYASFTFSVQDSTDRFDETPNTYTFDVDPINDSPTAVDDVATMPEDESILIDVLANDMDVDGPSKAILGVKPASAPDTQVPLSLGGPAADVGNGTVQLVADPVDGNKPKLLFTPDANFNGRVYFSYVMNDGSANALPITAGVTFTVTPMNDPP